jgi:predicted transcriptional regulator
MKGDVQAGDLVKQTWKEIKNNYFPEKETAK